MKTLASHSLHSNICSNACSELVFILLRTNCRNIAKRFSQKIFQKTSVLNKYDCCADPPVYSFIYLLYLTLQLSISQPVTLKPRDTDALDMPDTAFRGFYYLSGGQQE